MVGESPLLFEIQTALRHIQGRGAGSGNMSYVESGALTRAETGGNRQFPVLEPGRAWLWPLWPNRGAGFGPQSVAFWSSPHPLPGAYKRSSAEPLESPLRCLLFALCLDRCWLFDLLSPLRFAPCLAIGV